MQYRLEQDMCGTYFAGPPVGVHIMGDINTPWTVDGVLQQEIEVSKGDYPFKVKLQWGNATDQEQLVDQFRIYRRLYTTHVDTGVGWTQVFSTEDLLTYEDEDLAAGLLYEYKVGALMTCGDGNGNEVRRGVLPTLPQRHRVPLLLRLGVGHHPLRGRRDPLRRREGGAAAPRAERRPQVHPSSGTTITSHSTSVI